MVNVPIGLATRNLTARAPTASRLCELAFEVAASFFVWTQIAVSRCGGDTLVFRIEPWPKALLVPVDIYLILGATSYLLLLFTVTVRTIVVFA